MSALAGADAQGPLIFLVAGEPSGDQLGARLMAALRGETGGKVRFAGVGGPRMAEQGLESLFPIDELAVMGLIEVIPKIPLVWRRIRQTAAAARVARPAALVTIDAPSFTLEVSQRLKGEGFPLVHYVAPSVWAWKAWRAERMARYLDHLLALLPFEPPYFERHGLATTVVGHPAVEAPARTPDPAAFRRRLGIADDATLVSVLPGSRRGEVRRHEPVMAGALALLKARFPKLHVLAPTVPTVAAEIEARAKAWPVPSSVLRESGDKFEAFAASQAAMATSGTIAVELAMAELPATILYRVGPVTAVLGRALLKIKFASLINLLLDRAVQIELLQEDCTAERVAETVAALVADEERRAAYVAGCREATAMMGRGGEAPSRRAARAILSLIGGGPESAG